MTETPTEAWQWQLPDVQEGECIEFCFVEADLKSVCPPHYVRQHANNDVADDESGKDNEGRCKNDGS